MATQCITPLAVRHKMTNQTIAVPCGRCPNCYRRRISHWSFRLMQEDKISDSSHFITLTYDTSFVPITGNGYMGLSKRDIQLFFKRLRKLHSGSSFRPLKYYVVGEYGGRTRRPHYHAIVFNCKHELIQDAWGLGSVHYGQVTEASVGYTLKYMMKPFVGALHSNDDRAPMFSLMSKGLGANYLSDLMKSWHLDNLTERMYCNLQDGKKISMPRYYKDKIYSETQRKIVSYFQKQKINQLYEEKLKKGGETYFRDKAEADIAAFRKADMQALRGRDKM